MFCMPQTFIHNGNPDDRKCKGLMGYRSKFIHSWIVTHADDTSVNLDPYKGAIFDVSDGAFWGQAFGVYR